MNNFRNKKMMKSPPTEKTIGNQSPFKKTNYEYMSSRFHLLNFILSRSYKNKYSNVRDFNIEKRIVVKSILIFPLDTMKTFLFSISILILLYFILFSNVNKNNISEFIDFHYAKKTIDIPPWYSLMLFVQREYMMIWTKFTQAKGYCHRIP